MVAKQQAIALAVGGIFADVKVEIPADVAAELRNSYTDGANTAAQVATMFKAAEMRAIHLYQHVAEIEDKAAAAAFVKGYRDHSKRMALAAKDKADVRAAERAEELASKMNRIVKAVHGFQKRVKVKGKKDVLKDVNGIGAEKVLAILNGPGTADEKLQKLPSQDTSRRKTPGEDPVQTRIKAATSVLPSLESMAQALGAKAKDTKTTERVSINILTASIRQCPEALLPEIINATLNRALASSDDTLKDWAMSARDHLTKAGVVKSTRKLVKQAEDKAKKPQGEVAK